MSKRPEPESIGFLPARICRLDHARAHELLEDLGLYRGQYHMLRTLWKQDGLTHSELAKRLHVRPATVTKTTQRMEKAGLVACKPDADDQRVSRVYLTEAERTIKEDVQQVWHRLDEEKIVGFTLEERALLRRFFLQIRENLRATRTKQD